MATEQERLMEHNYDGIQEYDNPMPRWWVWIFWATIIFSVAYYFDFTGRIAGPGREKEYAQQLADAAKRWPAPTGPVDLAALTALAASPSALAEGKTAFTTYCAACHRPDGGGLIGPNLTDDFWLHGNALTDINRVVNDGVLDKGMPAWKSMLKPDLVNAVTVYVASLHGSNPKDPKAPQGVKPGEAAAK